MARLLEFNEDEALGKAMHAFRKLGYNGVSIKTLEAETGLSSGSIYNSFGGKDAIFQRTLQHYNETVVKKRIAKHLETSTPTDGLVSLFESLLEEPNGTTFGCLLTNSAVEFAGANDDVGAEIKRGFDLFLAAFKTTLGKAGAGDIDTKSTRLLAYYQGLLVLIRHGHDKAAIASSIRSEITSILGETNA